MSILVLSVDDAAKVRGISPTDPNAVLDPVPLKDGTFMLGDEVLVDSAHSDVSQFLAKLPTVKGIAPDNTYGEADVAALNVLAVPRWNDVGVRKNKVISAEVIEPTIPYPVS